MSELVQITAFPALWVKDHNKPKFTEPCNNCGLCCRVQACHVSREFLKSEQAPCIALEYHDGKFLCGMTIRPLHYLELPADQELHKQLVAGFRELLYIGQGCGMRDEIVIMEIERVRPEST